ncbi:MAG: histidine kinase [Nocardioides sp.]
MGLTPRGDVRAPWLDAALTLGAVAVDLALFTALSDATDQTGWAGRPAAGLVVVAGLLAVPLLWWRRSAPVRACVAVAVHGAAVTTLLGSRPLVGPLVALYAAAARGRRGPALAALGAVLAAHSLGVAYEASFTGPGPSVAAVAAVAMVYGLLDLGSWAVGRFGAGAAARARERRLEESRAEEARAAVEAERRRIARELHDIVAHAVTVMVLQAAGAKGLVESQPARATTALDAVEAQGRQAVAELRRLLGVLQPEPGETVVPPPRSGSVADAVDEVAASLRQAGLAVSVTADGDEVALDPSVSVTLTRAVREGLVNVARHGGREGRAQVRLSWAPERVLVEVVNPQADGAGPAAALSSGYGLTGLAERVRLVGGRLSAEPAPAGFRLAVELPTAAAGHDQELAGR